MKNIIEINGRKISSVMDFHEEIMQKMGFPDFYGKNLDALWDCLTGSANTDVHIVWKNHLDSKEKLGSEFSKLLKIFNDLKSECPEFRITLD